MWTRRQLKEKAKLSFRKNYWKCVVVALFITFLIGSGGSGSIAGSVAGMSRGSRMNSGSNQNSNDMRIFPYNMEGSGFGFDGGYGDFDYDDDEDDEDDDDGYEDDEDDDDGYEDFDGYEDYSDLFDYDDFEDYIIEYENENQDGMSRFFGGMFNITTLIVIVVVVLIVFVILLILAILIDVFLSNPIEIGARRFFYRNLNETAAVKETLFGFDHSYRNIVETMFFRGLYTFLWSLLLLIPGIVKSYEYCMIPYILAEHPDMPREQVFAVSRSMMKGQKWKTFVLDLSFILWDILGALTLGIVNLFYVNPYRHATFAALYEALKFQNGQPYDAYSDSPTGGFSGFDADSFQKEEPFQTIGIEQQESFGGR